MSKKPNALVATVTGDVNFQELKNSIHALSNSLSFLDTLSDSNVSSMNKISDADKTYITDCLVEAANAQDLLPAYFNAESIRKDNVLNDSLYEMEDMVYEMYQTLKRNRMAAADRAYSGVSTFYGLIKSASDANVPKAIAMYRRLQDYHKKKQEAAKNRRRKEEAAKQTAFAEKALQVVSTN
jgi:hypothetical protein